MHKILQGDPFSEITLFLKGYNLSISRFQPNDMLFFIAGITELGNCVICYESFVFLFIVCTIKEGTAIPKPIQPNNKGIT